MTRISTKNRKPAAKAKLLLLSVSTLALASVPVDAAEVLFSSNGVTQIETGERISSGAGVLQVRLDNGATLSFVDGAQFTLNDDGSLTLHSGGVTVAGAGNAETRVIMPDGVEGRIGGTGNAASFSVDADGYSSGHALTGAVNIARAGRNRDFQDGMMWKSSGRRGVSRAHSLPGRQTPGSEPQVADMNSGGPVAAAENGLPVSLGDALAAAGASSDVLAIARRLDAANGNPSLEAYPAGDLAALVGLAANLQGAYGGSPFPAAQADIIRTYLAYLANGGSGAQFVTAYSGILTQYLDLVRAGGLPSQFDLASQADIGAFLAYRSSLGALGDLAAQDQVLASAYLEFISGGGNPDLFASQFTDLVEAYFAFVRGGGNPSAFTGASQELVDAYVAFLAESGLVTQLSDENQDILAAYLESGGFAFAETYAASLASYFAYLQSGGAPSASGDLSPEQLQAYLELLEGSGLFAQLLGDQAQFYADYLAFLQGGGDADDFDQLNSNIFAGYAGDLNAYFAFLQAGGLPSAFDGDLSLLAAYLDALSEAGALQAFLGEHAGFYADYLAFLQTGGDIDAWDGLNANIFAGYAQALDAYYAYLAAGGLPSQYDVLTAEQIAAYFAALEADGATGSFLAGLGDFYTDYLAYLAGGGNPDVYTGLPVLNLPAFANALNAYAAFLAAGGLPSDYDAASLSLLATYLGALDNAGELAALLGANEGLLSDYFAFLGGGGSADLFTGLPIYAEYVAALNAYYAFLAGGGLPGDYAGLPLATLEAYLDALSGAGGFAAYGDLNAFFADYYAFVSGGGDPTDFAGIPAYADYLAAVADFYAFIAGGGLPSAYGALTQAQLQAYLNALAGAGLLVGNFTGDELTFYNDYLAYLAGGGVPDDFGGLPGGAMGGGAVFADALGFFHEYGSSSSGSVDADVEGDGTVLSFTYPNNNTQAPPANATQTDFGRIGDVVAWSRYQVPGQAQPNAIEDYLVGNRATNLPVSGTVNYSLLGGIAPADVQAAAGERGRFEGALGVAFGATPKVGLEMDVWVGDRGFHAQTTGGAADPSNGGMDLLTQLMFFTGALDTTGIAGDACASSCRTLISGGAYGDGASHLGFAYQIEDDTNLAEIFGVSVFGTSGTELDGLGTMPEVTPAPMAADPIIDSYLGGFTATDGRAFATDGGNSQPGDAVPTLDANGALVSAGNLANVSATAMDIAGDEYAVLGRFSDGQAMFRGGTNSYGANDGLPYVVLAPAVGDLPTMGTIDYVVYAKTQPIFTDGQFGPGLFDGTLSIQFGSTLKYRTAGFITMPEQGGDVTYNFASIAYDSGAFQNVLFAGPGPADILLQGDVTGMGRGCSGSGCSISFYGGFAGDNPEERLGLVYQVYGGNLSLPRIQGSVIYAPQGTVPPMAGGGGMSSGGDFTSDFTGTRDPIVYYTFTGGSLATAFGGSADLVNGEVTGFSSILGTGSHGSTSIVEAGDVGDLAWARWTNGTVSDVGVFGATDIPIGSNGGYHVLAGAASTSLPASGKVDYDLIATTSPTDHLNSAPGTLTGDLAIQYGSTSTVGYEFQMNVGGDGWGVSTTGGAANPGMSEVVLESANSAGPIFGGSFSSITGGVTASGGACPVSCLVTISGALFGDNGAHAGVAVNVTDSGNDGVTTASGLAIFSAALAPSGEVPQANGLTASASETNASAPAADWDRWEIGGDTISNGNGLAMLAPEIAPGIQELLASGVRYTPEQLAQLEAFFASSNPVN